MKALRVIAGLAVAGALLTPVLARADAPIAIEADRSTPGERRLYALGGTAGFGVGALLAPSFERARALEVYAALNDATVEARYGESFVFLHRGAFAWSAHASGSLRCTYLGPFDCGVGPTAGASFGWGGARWDVFFGASAGLEYFLVTGGPRFPLRLSVGTRWTLGPLVLGLTARGGADLERGLAPAGRADVVLDVGLSER